MIQHSVVGLLKDIARLMELSGENSFKIRAYNNASRALLKLDEDLDQLIEEGRLREIPGIGAGIEQVILEFAHTGTAEVLRELSEEIPLSLLELYGIPGLGSKRIRRLYDLLQITNLGELEYACEENRLLTIGGFGAKSQGEILEGIKFLRHYQNSFLHSQALNEALQLKKDLTDLGFEKPLITGALRRGLETVDKIELLIPGSLPREMLDLDDPPLLEPVRKSAASVGGRTSGGIPAIIHFCQKEQLGTALTLTTGNEAHLRWLRRLAPEGLLPPCSSEQELYQKLGLPLIPPELREGFLEIENRNLESLLDCLLQPEDLQGVFHNHSNYSDGVATLQQIAQHGQKLGYAYLGIADHSQSAFYANGLKPHDLRRQMEEIAEINSKTAGFTLLKGLEVDILSDGSLDCAAELLRELDYVVASVHSSFKMPEEEMTARVLKALANPYVTMLGHPTGRLLLAREPYALDLEQVIEACLRYDVALEINANPHRLDLDWRWARKACEAGVLLAINPDAHRLSGFEHTQFGVKLARKAGLPKKAVLNTWELEKLLQKFQKKKEAAQGYSDP